MVSPTTAVIILMMTFTGILLAIGLPIAHQKDIDTENALKYNCHNTEFLVHNFYECNRVGIYNITQTNNELNK